MDNGPEHWSKAPSSLSSLEQHRTMSWRPPKRPAGRTKFRETRHPVYRGVRRRGSAGRWVCEVRIPGRRGERLWLGTHATPEAAARAHDAALLALHGRSAAAVAYLNFPDSAWLLAVPASLSDPAAFRSAVTEAVADFQRREAAKGAATVPGVDVVSSASTPPSADNAGSSATLHPCSDGTIEVPAALGSDLFELDMSGEMDLRTYYKDLADGLLLEPPPTPATGASWDTTGDCGEGGADTTLWSD